MGIFDFFKKKQERKSLSYENLANWILEQNSDMDNSKNHIINKIKEEIEILKKDLASDIIKLNSVEIDNKKAENKLKLVVKENLEKYIGNLNYLIKSVDRLNFQTYEQTIVEIDTILNDFKKRSLMHYEKATILIGDELEKTKDTISTFSKNINNIIQENQQTIKKNKNIQLINEELSTINSTNTMIQECKSKIIILKENIKLKEKEIEEYKQAIIDLKNSKEYKNELKEKAEFLQLKIDYDNKINEIKFLIDFKQLSKLHHSDNKKMKMINEFKDNFKESYEKDFEKLLNLLKESSMYKEEIPLIINEISNLNSILKSKQSSEILEKEILSKEQTISSLTEEIKSINEEVLKEQRIEQKFNESKLVFIDKIKAILMSMNIELN